MTDRRTSEWSLAPSSLIPQPYNKAIPSSLQHWIQGSKRNAGITARDSSNRQYRPPERPVPLQRFSCISGTRGPKPAHDVPRGNRSGMGLISVHGTQQNARRQLVGRLPDDVRDESCEQAKNRNKNRSPPHALPQCGHLALACRRLLPQLEHFTMFP
jgi:hypothetical protein